MSPQRYFLYWFPPLLALCGTVLLPASETLFLLQGERKWLLIRTEKLSWWSRIKQISHWRRDLSEWLTFHCGTNGFWPESGIKHKHRVIMSFCWLWIMSVVKHSYSLSYPIPCGAHLSEVPYISGDTEDWLSHTFLRLLLFALMYWVLKKKKGKVLSVLRNR